jgi:hypothetical protein
VTQVPKSFESVWVAAADLELVCTVGELFHLFVNLLASHEQVEYVIDAALIFGIIVSIVLWLVFAKLPYIAITDIPQLEYGTAVMITKEMCSIELVRILAFGPDLEIGEV